MMSAQLEQALVSREVLRVQGNGLDARLYDTGQVLALGSVTKEKHSMEGNKRIIEEIEVPARVTYNLRTGDSSHWIDNYGGGSGSGYPSVQFFSEALDLLQQRGADLSKWKTPGHENGSDPRIYPELTDFVKDVHESFVSRKWERHELAIKGFLPTLAGHGNIPPWALLHPLVIAAYIKGTVFPFERTHVFDFEKGRKKLEGREDYVPTEEGTSYDGNAVLIRPWHLSNPDERHHSVIEAYFFNPANYQKFLKGELNVESLLPSRRDWMFNVSYGIEDGRKWLHFSCYKFNEERERKEGLAKGRKNDLYLKVDHKLIDDIERMSPLPL